MNDSKTIWLKVRVPEELRHQLKIRAAVERTSLQAVVEAALREYIANHNGDPTRS